ncbi:sirohydrochlorin cobaltochelatase [Oleidesulfovibrio sp.]|uniref:sirohydrochlorin cobaltochelatase n=1 Tax=Oleidesulfovibrio sp. TaxID=2909707 RepID=UPI003A893E1F
MKFGILLAAFGASNQQAHHTLRLFDERVRQRFPDMPVRWAFTSELIRDRLAARRMKTDSVTKALQKMCFEKFTHVAIQSLHIIPGAEYDDLCLDAQNMLQGPECVASGQEEAAGNGFMPNLSRFQNVAVGKPLLHHEGDVQRAAAALVDNLPQERQVGDVVVFMGHGTWHTGDSRYEDLSAAVRGIDPDVYIGTMDGSHTIDDVLPALVNAGAQRAYLLPLLSVVGRHAMRDMAGNQPDSWRSRIEQAGIECIPVLKGTVEYGGFVNIWIDHLEEAVNAIRP